ncbi:DUF6896 domain-containing protein [Nocardia asteroides]|uniref:DUF6896 domain-containing protein n=1 Tax=Nocardia asteroides TaxID=1824 RepID=UPI0037907B08
MTPDQIAAWFVESLSEIRALLIEELEVIPNIAALVFAVNRKEMPRRGTAGDLHYSVHGIGCEIEDKQGNIVDVDIAEDERTEIFDSHRIRSCYKASFDESVDVSAADILESCRALQNRGVLVEEKSGWFSICQT